ncbi:MAG: polysaccharide biosynthesis protein [Eubacteriales bacterium]|nr:polysaccharide biosynthesis protein [Eubacteriales bacterium]
MSKGQKSFVKGAAILGAAGLVVKLIGAIFRIPLTNIIGWEGMANYQVAYPLYAALVVISTAGLPAAISRMVSERVTVGDFKGAHKVFQTAFKVLLIIGIVSTIILLSISGLIANATGIPSAKLSLMMIAPALLFVALLSAYRGYFQGLQEMVPTAATQIIEQIVKLGAGLYLASLWIDKGVEYGAAGALLGVSISEICALVLVIGLYNRKKKDLKENRRKHGSRALLSPDKSTAKELLRIAVPITLGACIMPIVGLLDTLIVTNTMATINYSAYNLLSPIDSFGVLTGSVNPLINMPAVLSLALCMSLVPAISEAKTRKDAASVGTRSAMGFKLAILIGLPCAVGMYLLAQPIITLLYSSRLSSGGLSAEEIAVIKEGLRIGAELLRTLSIGVLFLTMLQTMTGILQGAGKQHIPLINLGIGAVVKVVLSIALIRIPSLNINGAAIGTAACYGIAALLNIAAVIKYTKPNIKAGSGLLMPVISTAVMGAAVYFIYNAASASLGNTKSTLICIAAAIIIYVLMLFITGSLQKEDMAFIPGGGKVTRLMNKLRFWRE